jgi:hypothetical protein
MRLKLHVSMRPKKSNRIEEDALWITNISKKAIHLSDLNVVIRPFTSLNLIDKRHSDLTRAQVEKSEKSGSLCRYKNYVVVRKIAPGIEPKMYLPFDKDAVFPTKHRSTVEPDNVKYEELEVSDDSFAADNAELAEADHLGKWKK